MMRYLLGSLRVFAAATALFAASCSGMTVVDPNYTSDYRDRFPINVAPQMRTLRVPYGGAGAGISPATSSQLRAFVGDYIDRGTGAISIAAPDGLENAALEYAGHIVAMGVPRERVMVAADPTPQAGREIGISFIQYVAETMPCGDWSESVAHTLQNRRMPNFGCAMQHNLAVMVADPGDFVAPKPLGASDVQRRMTVLEKYRAGEPTAAIESEGQTGGVSGIAEN